VRKEDLNIVFLMETRLTFCNLEFLRVHLGMGSCFGVDRHGYGGGLPLLWDSCITIQIRSFSDYHIDAEVLLSDGLSWRITGFYGHPEAALRVHSWALLQRLHHMQDLPWIVLGDFKEILSLDEQWGRHQRSLPRMAAFRDALLDCSLQDLGYHGPHFSWFNRRGNHALVRVRLDRGVVNPAWLALFPLVQVHHVVIASSDHVGVSFDLTPAAGGVPYRGRRRRFRFDKNWIREVGCEDKIKEAWNSCYRGTAMYRVAEKIKHCRVMLLQWSRSHVCLSSRVIVKTPTIPHPWVCLP
jgi:hypothetical protein